MRAWDEFVNWLADMDWGWWPLLSLRPPKDVEFDAARILKLSAFFGAVLGLIGYAYRASTVAVWSFSIVELAVALVVGVLVFGTLFSTITVMSWNRRARRLRVEHEAEPSPPR